MKELVIIALNLIMLFCVYLTFWAIPKGKFSDIEASEKGCLASYVIGLLLTTGLSIAMIVVGICC